MRWIDAEQTRICFRVEGKTAPGPILGMRNKFSLQGIHVHILQFFDEFLLTPHVKIIEARRPELGQGEWSELSKPSLSWRADALWALRRNCRDTRCFKTFITEDGVPLAGPLISRWICSGM